MKDLPRKCTPTAYIQAKAFDRTASGASSSETTEKGSPDVFVTCHGAKHVESMLMESLLGKRWTVCMAVARVKRAPGIRTGPPIANEQVTFSRWYGHGSMRVSFNEPSRVLEE